MGEATLARLAVVVVGQASVAVDEATLARLVVVVVGQEGVAVDGALGSVAVGKAELAPLGDGGEEAAS